MTLNIKRPATYIVGEQVQTEHIKDYNRTIALMFEDMVDFADRYGLSRDEVVNSMIYDMHTLSGYCDMNRYRPMPRRGRNTQMTNEEFETVKKENAGALQLLLDEMRQLHDWIVLNPVTDVTQENYKDWADSLGALLDSFEILDC